ncbi:hypothetical protein BKA66DRAFT_450224 [Pyrenochaeta sp. MPI-SDFR-AT-0127]|nr:hypothetical protein BKA66DRAFT_450224 [Pyrenochaeta sp. MPI-SDFR-AT-0127]
MTAFITPPCCMKQSYARTENLLITSFCSCLQPGGSRISYGTNIRAARWCFGSPHVALFPTLWCFAFASTFLNAARLSYICESYRVQVVLSVLSCFIFILTSHSRISLRSLAPLDSS